MKPNRNSISRREFATRAALGAVAAATTDSLSSVAIVSDGPQLPANAPQLSEQGQSEAQNRYQAILAQYPDRFSETQKADLRRLCFVLQAQLDALRAWPITNSDAPALYLKPLVEREKKANAAPNLKSAPQSAKPDEPEKPAVGEKR